MDWKDLGRRFFNKKTLGLFGASLLLTAVSAIFDESRDEMRTNEIIDETTERQTEALIRRLEKEGYIKKDKKNK